MSYLALRFVRGVVCVRVQCTEHTTKQIKALDEFQRGGFEEFEEETTFETTPAKMDAFGFIQYILQIDFGNDEYSFKDSSKTEVLVPISKAYCGHIVPAAKGSYILVRPPTPETADKSTLEEAAVKVMNGFFTHLGVLYRMEQQSSAKVHCVEK